MDRRQFLNESSRFGALAVAGSMALDQVAKAEASERVRIGMIGAGGRAFSLLSTFAANKNAEIVALADLDSRRLPKAVETIAKLQGKAPRTTDDFRKVIDDNTLDAIVIGTPDHWHAIPTILACLAGRDVYVEKPDGHNIEEGRRMVAAATRNNRIVQLGTQARTSKRMQQALEFIKTGALGRCLVAKAWESGRQKPIGRLPDGEAPAGVNYDMWLGAAPKRPFNPLRFHGNWRWFFDYGTGDLGNDGVHRLDYARWAFSAACEAAGDPPLPLLPQAVSASGGKWYFDDAQEFPDTLQVNYEYGGARPRILTYEMRIWAPYKYLDESEGAAIFGDKGYIVLGNTRWKAFGEKGKELASGEGENHEAAHAQNFLDCIKSRQPPNADLITVGHPSSVLCHAGNISARLGRKLVLDPATETFVNDREANALRTRPEYRKPWVLPEV